MRKLLNAVVVLSCICSITSIVSAGGPSCSGKGEKTAMSGSCCSKMAAGFPTMTMMVGDKSFDCPIAAGEAAKASHGKVIYTVAGTKFECQDKAMNALADASEDFTTKFTTIACVVDGKVMYCDNSECSGKSASAAGKSCCKSGDKSTAKTTGATMASAKGSEKSCCKDAKNVKYMVLGKTFDKRDDAVKARDAAMTRVKLISTKYVVDGHEYGCPVEAKSKATGDKKIVYVVNNEKMNCPIQARVAAAKAKYEAAKIAAEKLAKA